jgi:hypothetical protein
LGVFAFLKRDFIIQAIQVVGGVQAHRTYQPQISYERDADRKEINPCSRLTGV